MSLELFDTIILAASEENFDGIFMIERRWYGVRVDSRKATSLKWLAIYRSAPVSAVTHYAPIAGISEDPRTGRMNFDLGEPKELRRHIKISTSRPVPIQGQRYVSIERLLAAKDVGDLLVAKGAI